MRFDVLTIFPAMFEGYFTESIIKRARERGLLDVRIHDLRAWTTDKHHKVDDKPYGGGPGMVMKVEPFYRALKELKAIRAKKTRVVLMSAKGKRFSHKDAVRLSKYKRLVLLCGRYEGVDERVAQHLADEEISIGDFVLTGGELPAMTVIDAVSRHVPGVLGKAASLAEESHAEEGITEYPQYTRPETFSPAKNVSWKVPATLVSGDHAKVAAWRAAKRKTRMPKKSA
ncbi:MAG TPA: tRNA (guanosine(37)-N1)-methyltransferase TrmD [Patescibacteria group bacterium]|nr:tRNA (guanosine(37)-N1)-methyltransferase TrmD [Patescibacteria group bacterium]